MKLKEVVKKLCSKADEKAPSILSASALVGIALTAYSAYRLGVRSEEILKHRREQLSMIGDDHPEIKKEINKKAVKDLAIASLPTALSMIGTGTCVIAAQKENSKRLMMVTAAYNISESTIKSLNAKMKDVLGEKKARQVKDEIKKDRMRQDGPVTAGSSNVILGTGDVLCKDLFSGRLFASNAIKIERAITQASNDALLYDFVSLNDLYDYLRLERTQPGSYLGYNSSDLVQNRLPIEVTALLTDDGQPCLCIDYDYMPPKKRKRYGDM